MPPTSSWWALETPVTLARCGSSKMPSGGHGGGGGAIGGHIGPQPPSHVFFNTARLEGHQISKMWQELKRRFDCLRAAGGAASKADGRRLLYALVKIAYGGRHGTHGTVPA